MKDKSARKATHARRRNYYTRYRAAHVNELPLGDHTVLAVQVDPLYMLYQGDYPDNFFPAQTDEGVPFFERLEDARSFNTTDGVFVMPVSITLAHDIAKELHKPCLVYKSDGTIGEVLNVFTLPASERPEDVLQNPPW